MQWQTSTPFQQDFLDIFEICRLFPCRSNVCCDSHVGLHGAGTLCCRPPAIHSVLSSEGSWAGWFDYILCIGMYFHLLCIPRVYTLRWSKYVGSESPKLIIYHSSSMCHSIPLYFLVSGPSQQRIIKIHFNLTSSSTEKSYGLGLRSTELSEHDIQHQLFVRKNSSLLSNHRENKSLIKTNYSGYGFRSLSTIWPWSSPSSPH